MRQGRSWFVFARVIAFAVVIGIGIMVASMSAAQAQETGSTSSDPRLQKAYRFQQGGWTYVHLEGSPSEIGYQHGFQIGRASCRERG